MFLTPVTWGNAQGEHDAVLPLSVFLPPHPISSLFNVYRFYLSSKVSGILL